MASATQGERCALSLTSGGDPLFTEQELQRLTADFTQKLAGGAGPLEECKLSEDGLEGGEAPFGRSGTQSRQGGTLVDFRLRSPKVFTKYK